MLDPHDALRAIQADPHYQRNLDWGEPRPGHPEGPLRNHIADLEQNLERLRDRLDEAQQARLMLLIHTHDTFKPDSIEGAPIRHPRSHASLARTFLQRFHPDEQLLTMVQYHDEPFALWRQFKHKGHFDRARLDALLQNISDWDSCLAFLIIDGCTEGKSREPLLWFFRQIEGKVSARISAADIL